MRLLTTRRRVLSAPLALAGAAVLGGPLPRLARVGGGVTEEATPPPTPEAPRRSRREGILAAAYEALPAGPLAVTLTRLHFPPGSRAAGDGSAGPRLLVVERQTITVVLAEPGLLQRAATLAADAPVLVGGEVVLAADDGLVSGTTPDELRNDGERPSSVLIAEVVTLPPGLNGALPAPVDGGPTPVPGAPPFIETTPEAATPGAGALLANVEALPVKPFLTPNGVLVEPLAGAAASALPDGEGEVRLDRLTLPVTWDVPLPVQPGAWLLLVESGQLGLAARTGTVLYRSAAAVNPATVPGRAKRVAPDSEALVTAGGMAFLLPGADVALRNRGRTTLSVLTLAVVPARADVIRVSATSA